MTIDELRKTEAIQAHHWKAATWFAEQVLMGTANVKLISVQCREFEASLSNCGIDSFDMLTRVCVSREKIPSSEKFIGVLREALNVIHRTMPRCSN